MTDYQYLFLVTISNTSNLIVLINHPILSQRYICTETSKDGMHNSWS